MRSETWLQSNRQAIQLCRLQDNPNVLLQAARWLVLSGADKLLNELQPVWDQVLHSLPGCCLVAVGCQCG